MGSKHVFGIDLGTTYSCIAYVDEYGKPVVLPNAEGDQTTPSVVYFEGEGTIVVGKAAKESAKVHPDRVVECVKRSMGDPNYEFAVDGALYRAPEISALILKKLVTDAQQNTPGGEAVQDVVITCPAYFGVNQKDATKQAGVIAGLNVLYVIPEPTAAAMAYAIESAQDQVVLVYDLGGGTFDITLIELKDQSVHVIATGGDDQLGGRDWDECVVEHFARKFEEDTGISASELLADADMQQELFSDAEKCKVMLSSKQSFEKNIRFGSAKANIKITRDEFDAITEQLLLKTFSFTDQMIEKASQLGFTSIQKILLVGGSTYMPQVHEYFNTKYPFEVVQFRPNLAVAEGAALFGFKFKVEEEVKRFLGEDDLTHVSDAKMKEAAKNVAATLGLPAGRVEELARTKVINVTSKSFGVVVVDDDDQDKVCNLIKEGDSLPRTEQRRFGTREEGQTSVTIRLMESLQTNGPDELYSPSLCTAELYNGDLPFGMALPKGSPLDITFELGPDGRLHVYVRDVTTGKDKTVDLQTDGVLSKEAEAEAKARVAGLSIT